LNVETQFRIDQLSAKDKIRLFKDLSRIHSYSVCNVITKVDQQAEMMLDDKQVILHQIKQLEEQK